MTMKRLLPLLCAAALLAACDNTPVAHIDATVDRAPDSSVVLQKLSRGRLSPVDTLRTDWCYWKALSLRKLGDEAAARAIGEAMKAKGSAVLEDYVDFFD